MKRKLGRRVGDSNNRQYIINAARSLFAAEGYSSTTIRKVAAAACVDPSLVIQFFKSKEKLFSEAMSMSSLQLEKIARSVQGPIDGIAERLILAFWEVTEGSREQSELFIAMYRATSSNEIVASEMSQLIQKRLVEVISPNLALSDQHRDQRIALAMSMLVGIFIGKAVMGVPVLSHMTRDEIMNLIRDPLQLLFELPTIK